MITHITEVNTQIIQNAYWKSQTQLLIGLQDKIKEYLLQTSFVVDLVTLGAIEKDNKVFKSTKTY